MGRWRRSGGKGRKERGGGAGRGGKGGEEGGGVSVSVAVVKGNGSQSGVIGNYQLQEEQTIVRRLGQS